MRRLRCFTRNVTPFLLGFVVFVFMVIQRQDFLMDRIDSATNKGTILSTTGSTIISTNTSTTTTNQSSTNSSERSLFFIPEQFLEEYIQQHSQETLWYEFQSTSTTTRRFAVAYYWCPERAGNSLNSFFNTIVWAMIHNRTVLWKYLGTVDQRADCQAVLRLADWMPSFDTWQIMANLTDAVAVPNDAKSWAEDQIHQVVLYPQIPDVSYGDTSITRNAWSDHPMKTKEYQQYLQALPESFQNRATNLYTMGKSFLYGMLYTRLFQLQRDPGQTTTVVVGSSTTGDDDTDDSTTKNIYSIGIHSRHTVAADDGSWIPQEINCLERFLYRFHTNTVDDQNDLCQVYLMSDRPKTIRALTEWLSNKNCSVITANHHVGDDPIQEHGPWAGAGYLEDLDVVAKATQGLIGDPRRSSTSLLLDLMEYRRYLEWGNGDNHSVDRPPKLEICKLPNKPPSGYDYGPGTPTFRHHSFLEPLAPIRVIQDYIHSKDRTRKGAVSVEINVDRPSVKQVYNALNAFLLAILYDLDLQLQWNISTSRHVQCGEGASLSMSPSWAGELGQFDNIIDEKNRTENGILVSSYEGYDNFDPMHDTEQHLRYNANVFPIWSTMEDMTLPRNRATDLFALGQDVTYGLLFNELFSFCPHRPESDPLSNAMPMQSVILEVSSGIAPDDADRIRSCVLHVLNATPTDDMSGTAETPCHIYVLSDQSIIQDTAVAPLIRELSPSSEPSIWIEHDMVCSFSFFSIAVGDDDNERATDTELGLSQNIWNIVHAASHARGGWIQPKTTRSQNDTFLGENSKLIRERVESTRHTEQWKKGREPFVISPFQECRY